MEPVMLPCVKSRVALWCMVPFLYPFCVVSHTLNALPAAMYAT